MPQRMISINHHSNIGNYTRATDMLNKNALDDKPTKSEVIDDTQIKKILYG